jgi:hypothetical protein
VQQPEKKIRRPPSTANAAENGLRYSGRIGIWWIGSTFMPCFPVSVVVHPRSKTQLGLTCLGSGIDRNRTLVPL